MKKKKTGESAGTDSRLKKKDNTDRKKTEEKIKETTRGLKATKALSEDIVEAMPASILVFDKSMRMVSANKNFYQKTGKKKNDNVGKTIDYIFYPVIDARRIGLVDKMKEVFKTEKACEGERIHYHHRLFFYKITPLRDEKGDVAHAMLIMEDVTEVTKLGQEIIEANKKLKSAVKKLETLDKMKDEFLSIVSHELKTPVTPIKGYLELLLDGDLGRINKKQREALETSLRRIQHLQRMIDDIVDISRMRSEKMKFDMKPIDLSNIIEDTIKEMRVLAYEKQVDISENMPRPLHVTADETRMAQVVSNLIDNSIKFSTNGGRITINAEKEDRSMHVKISDTGPGIPKKHHKKIFEKFYQVDSSPTREFDGTGLGLPICEKIIKKHGGSIWVESKVGEGSTFHFTLPAT